MSEIQKALATATDTEPSKRRNETITDQGYMKRLAQAVGDLSDDDWAKLPVVAQDWYNAAADALEKNQDIPVYADVAPPAGTSSTRRRSAEPAAEPYKPKKGDTVKVITKRGKDYTGDIDEVDSEGLVLVVDGRDVELDMDKIESITQVGAGGSVSGGGDADDGPADPEVGDTVEVVTKRGKTVVGNVKEMTDDEMVIVDSAGDEHEFDRDKLTSVKVKVKNSGAAASGKASPAAKKAASGGDTKEKEPRATAKSNGGVSVTQRIRELIVENLDAKKDDIAAALKKESLECKPQTLDLTYAESHKLIGILREKKKLK